MDFMENANNVQIISYRKFSSELELNLLRYFAKLSGKTFKFYAINIECIVVKPEDRDQVLKGFHDAPLGGHVGGKKMLKRMKPFFTWESRSRH